MRFFIFFIVLLLICSCNSNKNPTEATEKAVPERGALSWDSQIFLGNRLFSEKKCITCHDVNKKKTGPSVKEIINIYKEKNGDCVALLRGRTKQIVDTTSSQVAIMQANIDGFLHNISDKELKTIATYILHVDDLNPEQGFMVRKMLATTKFLA